MDLYQLNHFITLAKTLNYTNASEQLYISQPTLSRSILILEQEIGVPLFERSRQAVKLTEYGEAFLPYARQILRDYSTGVSITRDALSNKQGRITIGVYTWGFEDFLPILFKEIRRELPGIKISCIDGTTPKLLQYLKEGKIDIALTTIRRKDKWVDLSATQIFESDINLIVSKDNPLSQKDCVYTEDLQNEHFFHLDPTAVFSAPLDKLAKLDNETLAEPQIQSVESLRMLLTMVSNNLGIALLHRRNNIFKQYPNIVTVPFIETDANGNDIKPTMSGFYVFNPMNNNPNIQSVCKIISEIAPDYLPPDYC